MKKSCRIEKLEEKLSVSIVLVIENEVISANIGKIKSFYIQKTVQKKVEYLNSISLTNNAMSLTPYITQVKFNNDVKYIVMGSSLLWEKSNPSNLFKVICVNRCNLEEKAEKIFQYETKLARSNTHIENPTSSLVMIEF